MSQPVTVLIPVRNAMPHLRHTLASVAAQTHGDLEVLVWDNGSTDGSVAEARRWVGERLAGRVVADRPLPLGLCRARMVEAARTELIAWIDADDIMEPQRLALQIEAFEREPRLGAVGSQLRYINADGSDRPGEFPLPLDDASIRWTLRFGTGLVQGTAMLRRSVVLAAGNYRQIRPAEDPDLFVRMAARAPMRNLPQRLLRYRQHDLSVTAQDRGVMRSTVERMIRDNAGVLFPGLGVEEGLGLYRLLQPGCEREAGLADLIRLWRVAGEAGRAVGRGGGYFRNTPEFKAHWRRVLGMWAGGWPGGSGAWRWGRRAAGLGRGKAEAGASCSFEDREPIGYREAA